MGRENKIKFLHLVNEINNFGGVIAEGFVEHKYKYCTFYNKNSVKPSEMINRALFKFHYPNSN